MHSQHNIKLTINLLPWYGLREQYYTKDGLALKIHKLFSDSQCFNVADGKYCPRCVACSTHSWTNPSQQKYTMWIVEQNKQVWIVQY
jgi:hypothetical protein